MIDTLAHLKKDRCFCPRLLRLAGYYHGKIDGRSTRDFRYSQAKLRNETEGLRWLLGWVDMESEANISTLLPEAQRAARSWLKYARVIALEAGYDVRIICGTRTYMEQDALFELNPDKTKARGGQSMHNFGLAWDIGIFQGKKHFPEHELYKILAQSPNTNPVLTWGGSSNHAHYQLNTYGDIETVRKKFEACGSIPACLGKSSTCF